MANEDVIEVVGVPAIWDDFLAAIGQLMLTPSGKRKFQRMQFIDGVVELRDYDKIKVTASAKKITIRCYNGSMLGMRIDVRMPNPILIGPSSPPIILSHEI